MAEATIDPKCAATHQKASGKDRANRIARNSVTSMDVMAAARDVTAMRSYTDTYGISIPKTGDITNQRQSGRCWMFSAFNVLRQEAIKFLDVDTFEFSQAYGMFYDKLEKVNSTLEYIIETTNKPADDRLVQTLLTEGIGDGGYYPFAMNLVKKYGLVPKSAMPETACSKNSDQMDARIDRLFRKDAALLRKAAANGATLDELHATKQKMLGDFYKILSVCLGEPPIKFDFELKVGKNCKADAKKLSPIEPSEKTDDAGDTKESRKKNTADKKGETDEKDEKGSQILRDFGITPLQFVERYCNVNPENFVALVSIPGTQFPYGKVYRVKHVDSVLGGLKTRCLNVEPEVLEADAIASLKAGHPVAMACDVMQEFPRRIQDFNYVLSTDTVDFNGLFGVDFDMDRTSMIDHYETYLTHAMTFQGVELDKDGKAKQWRIENSWGKDAGKDGYLIMSADWFRLYGGESDVRREYVSKELLELWDDESKDVEVELWSGMGRALGGRGRN